LRRDEESETKEGWERWRDERWEYNKGMKVMKERIGCKYERNNFLLNCNRLLH
jgi:hypothetical protein